MSRLIKVLIVFGVLLNAGQLQAQSVPSWVVPAALRFISNPDDFFFNLHLDNVDYAPTPAENRGELKTNLAPTFLPLTWANAALKIKLLNEGSFMRWVPQVDLAGSYGRIVLLDILSSVVDDEDFTAPTMRDYSIGVTLTKNVTRETRLFAGYHHSVFNMDLKFPDPIEITSDNTLDSLNILRKDNIMVTGITNRIAPEKSLTAYLGYGFNYKKVFSRFVWNHRRLQMGFNIYPEGLLVIHPFIGMHWGL